MEALLNDKIWWKDKKVPNTDKSPLFAIEKLRKEEAQRNNYIRTPEKFDIRLGWSSLLRIQDGGSVSSGTCWNANDQTFTGCFSEPGNISGNNDYIHPKHHLVKLSIENIDNAVEKSCELVVTGKLDRGYGFLESGNFTTGRETNRISFTCNKTVLARIPFDSQIKVKGHVGDKNFNTTTIKVRDFLIASMGDSFASGEGNPDLPAKLDSDRVISPKYDEDGEKIKKAGVPRRKLRPDGKIAKGTSARWIDRRCHRSMYSAHARAAIALALSGDRHHAVTFVSAACSGAEITDGLFWPQDGRECTLKNRAGSRFLEPQISALVGALGQEAGGRKLLKGFPNSLSENDRFFKSHLNHVKKGYIYIRNKNSNCKSWPGQNRIRKNPYLRYASLNRQIDLLFLTIGGNDMGFAPLVMGTVLTSGLTDLPFNDKIAKLYNLGAGGIDIEEANENLEYLPQRYAMLARAIEKKLEINEPSRVLMTTYPNPAFAKKGEFCDSKRIGMNVSHLLKLSGPKSDIGLANIEEASTVIASLNKAVSSNKKNFGYTIVDDFENRFIDHGFCAGSDENDEKFDIPFKITGQQDWKIYDPNSGYFPYEKKKRWFRSFNDSYLLMQHFKENAYEEKRKKKGNSIYLALRTLGGPVHPNAEAHAAIGDSLYCAAAKILLDGQNSAQCH